eukprot:2325410-Pleurochrysis_carterae.AAC.2
MHMVIACRGVLISPAQKAPTSTAKTLTSLSASKSDGAAIANLRVCGGAVAVTHGGCSTGGHGGRCAGRRVPAPYRGMYKQHDHLGIYSKPYLLAASELCGEGLCRRFTRVMGQPCSLGKEPYSCSGAE